MRSGRASRLTPYGTLFNNSMFDLLRSWSSSGHTIRSKQHFLMFALHSARASTSARQLTTAVCRPFLRPQNIKDGQDTSGTPYQVHVSAAKAAVEEGPRGVRSNVIAPGPIDGTEGIDRLPAKARSGSSAQGIATDWPADIPLVRLGDKRDIANAAVFLFSPAASFVNGAVLVVDGASQHIRSPQLPYPLSVLHPEKVRDLIKPRL